MGKQPFDMQQACFRLIAVLVVGATVTLAAVAGGCGFMVITGRMPPGTCIAIGITDRLTTMFQDVLTAVLALLLAARQGGPPPPPPPDHGCDQHD